MRIRLLVEVERVDDAGIVLETIGFEPDDDLPVPEPKDGLVEVIGELPDGNLGELESVAGLRDWNVLPPGAGPIWDQMPETD